MKRMICIASVFPVIGGISACAADHGMGTYLKWGYEYDGGSYSEPGMRMDAEVVFTPTTGNHFRPGFGVGYQFPRNRKRVPPYDFSFLECYTTIYLIPAPDLPRETDLFIQLECGVCWYEGRRPMMSETNGMHLALGAGLLYHERISYRTSHHGEYRTR